MWEITGCMDLDPSFSGQGQAFCGTKDQFSLDDIGNSMPIDVSVRLKNNMWIYKLWV